MDEAKLPGLADRAADADRWQEEARRQCVAQIEEHTLLQIRGPSCGWP
jgi:hypothetical protein